MQQAKRIEKSIGHKQGCGEDKELELGVIRAKGAGKGVRVTGEKMSVAAVFLTVWREKRVAAKEITVIMAGDGQRLAKVYSSRANEDRAYFELTQSTAEQRHWWVLIAMHCCLSLVIIYSNMFGLQVVHALFDKALFV